MLRKEVPSSMLVYAGCRTRTRAASLAVWYSLDASSYFFAGHVMTVSLRKIGSPEEAEAYRAIPQFNVSVLKLAVMSLCTLGFYQLYWSYKQWDAIRRRDKQAISPGWRAFFAPLWAFSLFPKIHELATKHGLPAAWSATGLALGFFVLGATWRLPAPYSLIALFAFLPLLVVQRAVNELNAIAAPEADRNDKYTGKNLVVIVLGALLLVLVILGNLLPDAGEVVENAKAVAV
jgi:hypothetical protein